MTNQTFFRFVISIVVFILNLQLATAQNDTLRFGSDEIVGEVKNLKSGVITIETAYSDNDFTVEWENVTYIHSTRGFIITVVGGDRYDGGLKTQAGNPLVINVLKLGDPKPLNREDIVTLEPYKRNIKDRFSAAVDVGVTLTKANNLKQFTTRSSVGYNDKSWGGGASVDAVMSNQDSIESTKRIDALIDARYNLRWSTFLIVSTSLLQNEEQNLKLRSTSLAGFGSYFVNTNKLYFIGSLGAGYTTENFTEATEPDKKSMESYAKIEFNIFDMGDLSLLTSAAVYPNITDFGRVRLDYKFDVKYDFPYDFYMKLGYTHNFDNKPVEGASTYDYVFQTTFGWEL